MNEIALIEELRKPEYASLSDQEASDAINAKTVAIRVPVSTAEAIAHASGEGYYCNLEDAANKTPGVLGTPQDKCRQAAINILKYIESSKITHINMDSEKVISMKIALIECGFATPQQVASLDALANKQVRWVDHYGHGTVGDGTIKSLRGML